MTAADVTASVVVPALDAAGTLEAQLRALARQQADVSWELLICDNGSTDGTAELARRWQGAIPGLRVVDASRRRGAAAARNAGAAVARGSLLLFCDADDEVGDGWLSSMVEALGSSEAVAGARRYDRLNAERFGPDDWTAPLFRLPFGPPLPAASSNNLGVRRAVFDEVGGFDESLRTGEDVDLCWRLQLAGHRLTGEPRAVVDVRRRSGVVGVFRQSYGYGLGDAVLARKHAGQVAVPQAAGVPDRAAAGSVPSADDGGPSRLRRALGRLVRLQRPVNPTFAAARVGRWLGRRRGAAKGRRA